ncbi:uncharacterized protein [Branchiostoma lanceolatum]|uniref:Hypp6019 protein n=1 Tax=Branchiostoma lanceolatum TaxID=7740 RepID=A0A8J9VTA1_BRALA|nr:Hypp6019 [Branchiostoma lanceolatum]
MAIDLSIPRVQNCCCCGSLKCGTIGIAVVFMIMNLLNVIGTLVAVAAFNEEGVNAFRIIDVLFDAILIILCIMLIVGAVKGNPLLCRIWIIGTIIFVSAMFILCIVGSSLIGLNNPEAAHVIGFFWFGIAVEEGLLIYGVIVVNSFVESLRHEDATLPPYSQVNESAAV